MMHRHYHPWALNMSKPYSHRPSSFGVMASNIIWYSKTSSELDLLAMLLLHVHGDWNDH